MPYLLLRWNLNIQPEPSPHASSGRLLDMPIRLSATVNSRATRSQCHLYCGLTRIPWRGATIYALAPLIPPRPESDDGHLACRCSTETALRRGRCCLPETSPAPPKRSLTPSFVCEIPLRVGPTEQRVLAARLEAARALYNACLGEARTRWFLVKQSRAYQHARILPRKTPERAEAFRAARVAHGCTEAALQAYAKDCRHASHWIEDHLDAPVCQHLATRAYRAVLRLALGKAPSMCALRAGTSSIRWRARATKRA
jgi:hypothetical protein